MWWDWIEFDSCWERGGRVQVPCTRTRQSSCRGDSFGVQTPPRASNTLHKLTKVTVFLSHSGQKWRQRIRWISLNSAPLKSSVSFKSSDRPRISDGIHSRWLGARAQACWGPSGRQLWHFKSLSKKMQMISIKGSFFTDMGGREMHAAN